LPALNTTAPTIYLFSFRPGIGIIPIEKEQSAIWAEPPKSKPIEFTTESENATNEPLQQLTLF